MFDPPSCECGVEARRGMEKEALAIEGF